LKNNVGGGSKTYRSWGDVPRDGTRNQEKKIGRVGRISSKQGGNCRGGGPKKIPGGTRLRPKSHDVCGQIRRGGEKGKLQFEREKKMGFWAILGTFSKTIQRGTQITNGRGGGNAGFSSLKMGWTNSDRGFSKRLVPYQSAGGEKKLIPRRSQRGRTTEDQI